MASVATVTNSDWLSYALLVTVVVLFAVRPPPWRRDETTADPDPVPDDKNEETRV